MEQTRRDKELIKKYENKPVINRVVPFVLYVLPVLVGIYFLSITN